MHSQGEKEKEDSTDHNEDSTRGDDFSPSQKETDEELEEDHGDIIKLPGTSNLQFKAHKH